MLNTGLILDPVKNEFNHTLLDSFISEMEYSPIKPNERLLNQFAFFLESSGYVYRRDRLFFVPGNQRVVSWLHPNSCGTFRNCKVILSSHPVAGKSYLKATILNSRRDEPQSFDFVAQSPMIIFHKLLTYGLIDPQKKGGDHV